MSEWWKVLGAVSILLSITVTGVVIWAVVKLVCHIVG